MDNKDKVTIIESLHEAVGGGRVWEGEVKVRLYLDQGCYVEVDNDGDLIGEGPKLSRVQQRQIWAPIEKAAAAIGRRLFC